MDECKKCANADRFWELHNKLSQGLLTAKEAEEMSDHPFCRFLCETTRNKVEAVKATT